MQAGLIGACIQPVAADGRPLGEASVRCRLAWAGYCRGGAISLANGVLGQVVEGLAIFLR